MTMMLAERGVHLTHVENGALALEAMQSVSFDLVLMDIHMPVMTGYEALAALQQENNPTRVAIMSASVFEADRVKAEGLGCYDYLVKPVNVDDVIELMNQVVMNTGVND
jgi:CheY-like chemotaxis protein